MATVRRWDPEAGLPQLATLRQILQGEGMITAWWSDTPGTRSPEHAHTFPETRWVLSGFLRIALEGGGEVVELGPGDRIDLPPRTRHSTEVVGLAPVVYVTGTIDRSVDPAFTIGR